MSAPAFYLPATAWAKHCVLTGEEAKHAQVLRLKIGEEVLVMDGKGASAICEIQKIDRKEIALKMRREWQTPAPESRPIIAIALSKAARRGFFLEKAAELGAWAVWLWQAQRSQGEIQAKLAESCRAQLRAGAKQCHNPWFPELAVLGQAEELAQKALPCSWRILPWEEKANDPIISLAQLGRAGETVYAIGPEGGLTEAEVACLRKAGFITASLGKRVLRCETAATLCLGLHWWASQLPFKDVQNE